MKTTLWLISIMAVLIGIPVNSIAESRLDRVLREQQAEYDVVLEDARDAQAIFESEEGITRFMDQATENLRRAIPSNLTPEAIQELEASIFHDTKPYKSSGVGPPIKQYDPTEIDRRRAEYEASKQSGGTKE